MFQDLSNLLPVVLDALVAFVVPCFPVLRFGTWPRDDPLWNCFCCQALIHAWRRTCWIELAWHLLGHVGACRGMSGHVGACRDSGVGLQRSLLTLGKGHWDTLFNSLPPVDLCLRKPIYIYTYNILSERCHRLNSFLVKDVKEQPAVESNLTISPDGWFADVHLTVDQTLSIPTAIVRRIHHEPCTPLILHFVGFCRPVEGPFHHSVLSQKIKVDLD